MLKLLLLCFALVSFSVFSVGAEKCRISNIKSVAIELNNLVVVGNVECEKTSSLVKFRKNRVVLSTEQLDNQSLLQNFLSLSLDAKNNRYYLIINNKGGRFIELSNNGIKYPAEDVRCTITNN